MTAEPTQPAAADPAQKSMDDIMALCKRRGFIYPASEIYGGINGFWDYGPLGAQLKKNLKDAWWRDTVLCPPDGPDGRPVSIVGLDSAIIQNPKVWEASGHVAGFHDPKSDCKKCKSRFRADHLWVVTWTDLNQVRAAIETAGHERNNINLYDYTSAVAAWGAGDTLSDEQEQKILELARLVKHGTESTYKPYYKCVVADSQARAIEAASLSERERTLFQEPRVMNAATLQSYNGRYDVLQCPACGSMGSLTEPRAFNLMFKTYIGATATEDDLAYLRPETAQGIFVNYKNVLDTTRVRVPFGVAQMGKAFRNEVTPRNYTFRSREFEQMEIEFFCHPSTTHEWYAFWRDLRLSWWRSLGLTGANLQLREHDRDELAHYAKTGAGTSDIEYRFPFTAPGFGELEGVADRSDFDLRQHAEHSGAKLEYFDQERNERYMPHVVEPSAGADRGVLALICEAYTPDPSRPSKVYMKFHPRVAPVKAAVFPLVNKDGMPEVGERLYKDLRARFGAVEFDPKQSIGKRYARMDEAGCPYCFTIDGETLTGQTVTVRDRDTLAQDRVALDAVPAWLGERLGG